MNALMLIRLMKYPLLSFSLFVSAATFLSFPLGSENVKLENIETSETRRMT